jgi:hypothetical protein
VLAWAPPRAVRVAHGQGCRLPCRERRRLASRRPERRREATYPTASHVPVGSPRPPQRPFCAQGLPHLFSARLQGLLPSLCIPCGPLALALPLRGLTRSCSCSRAPLGWSEARWGGGAAEETRGEKGGALGRASVRSSERPRACPAPPFRVHAPCVGVVLRLLGGSLEGCRSVSRRFPFAKTTSHAPYTLHTPHTGEWWAQLDGRG